MTENKTWRIGSLFININNELNAWIYIEPSARITSNLKNGTPMVLQLLDGTYWINTVGSKRTNRTGPIKTLEEAQALALLL